MLTTPILHPVPGSRSAVSTASSQGLLAVAAAGLLAESPLLSRHAAWLWERPHYQFFPFVLVGAAVLAFARIRTLTRLAPGSTAVAAIGLSAAWACLAAADILGSAWLACISCMTLLMSLAYAAGGRELCRRALPAWVLLWLVVPPPLDLDRLLMFKLQNLTTEWSSSVLDLFSVYHARIGNVIEVDGKSLMVEQACSGVNSLYSLLACTLFLVFLTRRGWMQGSLLAAAAVVWVLAANVARVALVVALDARWGIDVSTGWRHELLGVVMFAAAVLLLLSTDQFIAFLTQSERGLAEPDAPGDEVPEAAASPSPSFGRVAVLAAPAFLLLAVAFWSSERESLEVALAPTQLMAPEKQQLPEKVGSWTQTDYATQKRDAYSFFGEHSSTWRYSSARLAAQVSIDYPFPNWHDLTWCYTARGWNVSDQAVRSDAAIPGGFVAAHMDQPIHRHGYLLFCEFNARGEPLPARPGGLEASFFRHQTALHRARSRLGLEPEAPADPAGPIYQLQVFVDRFDPLSAEDEAAALELFIRAGASFKDFCARPR
jgi:exosortase